MDFYLIGVDYRSASLEKREEVYKKRHLLEAFLKDGFGGRAAVIFTCNRIEIYGVAEGLSQAEQDVKRLHFSYGNFFENGYNKLGEKEVFLHALRLASGLESQLKGEAQILDQLESWCLQGPLPYALRQLLSEALILSGQIRLKSGLYGHADNIAGLVIRQLSVLPMRKDKFKIALLGTGKVAELFSRLPFDNIFISFVAHKNLSKARYLAGECRGGVSSFADLPYLLLDVDALVAATASPHFVLREDHFISSIEKRTSPLYIYDLALPRDIDPKVSKLKNVILRNQDDLKAEFEEHNRRLNRKISLAERLIDEVAYNWQEKTYA
ncbi:MAG: hypothetical protein C4533_01000 [Candidatus Omnitrophota bacterium]|jgi:glutamyl-tRNA reductase|nr:MAG: hypothetical protein C4533_01000 [Candidatus Omnitrophota bacterium]